MTSTRGAASLQFHLGSSRLFQRGRDAIEYSRQPYFSEQRRRRLATDVEDFDQSVYPCSARKARPFNLLFGAHSLHQPVHTYQSGIGRIESSDVTRGPPLRPLESGVCFNFEL